MESGSSRRIGEPKERRLSAGLTEFQNAIHTQILSADASLAIELTGIPGVKPQTLVDVYDHLVSLLMIMHQDKFEALIEQYRLPGIAPSYSSIVEYYVPFLASNSEEAMLRGLQYAETKDKANEESGILHVCALSADINKFNLICALLGLAPGSEDYLTCLYRQTAEPLLPLTPIQVAAFSNNVSLLRSMCKALMNAQHTSFAEPDKDGLTLMHHAAKNGAVEVMEFLHTELHMPFDTPCGKGFTPFAYTALSLTRASLDKLIDLGYQPTEKDMADFQKLLDESEVIAFRLLNAVFQERTINMHKALVLPFIVEMVTDALGQLTEQMIYARTLIRDGRQRELETFYTVTCDIEQQAMAGIEVIASTCHDARAEYSIRFAKEQLPSAMRELHDVCHPAPSASPSSSLVPKLSTPRFFIPSQIFESDDIQTHTFSLTNYGLTEDEMRNLGSEKDDKEEKKDTREKKSPRPGASS